MYCAICGSENINESKETIQAEEFGIPTVTFQNAVITTCNDCGEETVQIPNHSLVMQQIREKICMLSRTITGEEFIFLRMGLKKDGQEIAKILKVSNVSVSRWENNSIPVNDMVDRHLRTLTLIDLDKGNQAISILENLTEHGEDQVIVDFDNFNDTRYIMETCFGMGNPGGTWKVITNKT